MADSHLVHVVELIHQRRARKRRRARTVGQRTLAIATVVLAAVSIVLAFAALAAAPLYAYVSFGLPSVQELEILLNPQTGELLQPTRLYDRTGQNLLTTLEPPNAPRVFIEASDNPMLATAFIASADPGFLDHGGFLWTSLNQRPTTLAERLAADLLLADEADGWLKNLRARMLASFVTARYGRQQILTWALNSATFGYWTFGVESAAKLYFGKPAAELSLAESALLAAVAQVPALNPFDAPELAIEYQRLVLVAMHEQGFINDAQFAAALTEPLHFASLPAVAEQAPDFANLVISQLEDELGRTRIQRGALEVITTLDLSLQQEIEAQEAEVVVLNPSNGQILALLGDARTPHPVEKMLYPFIYLGAFAQGRSPASLIWDLPDSSQSDSYLNHGPVSMREALANGYESAAAAVEKDLGNDYAGTVFAQFGLGSEPHSALDLAAAYAILANGGIRAQARTAILFVHDGDNLLLDHSQTQGAAVISGELAYLVTDVLGDASVRSTASLAEVSFARPTAVQAEETGEGSWFLAYSAQRVLAMWRAQPGSADIGSVAFEAAHRDLPIQDWHVPPGLSSMIVCVPSGQLPDADCPATRREFFLSGNLPTTTDTLFERVAVNTLTNKLATVFTPAEFIEERLFIQIPVEAEDWARAAGIDLIPTDYDSFSILDLESAAAAILAPEPFDTVSGIVRIFGRVPADVGSYDVQIGEGLFPSEWTLIAERDGIPSVGSLAEWDTAGLSGLYAIQLQVFDQEGNLFRAYSLVTVNN